jgi:phospho-N-acetylmuramoyl-pentapeptide-transferase
MLYHLALALLPYFSPLNVFTYHTVRAGGAAFTAFVFCLIFGPLIIRLLLSLKVGQFIKKDHVEELHKLHEGKGGTPTMGGTMIILSTVLSLLLWSTLTNRLLWLALGVFVLLGFVGFLDDIIKLKRKHNDGLSARAKFAGQILTGTLLGCFLYFNPITVSASYPQPRDVIDWRALVDGLVVAQDAGASPKAHAFWQHFDVETQDRLRILSERNGITEDDREMIVDGLTTAMMSEGFYDTDLWPPSSLTAEAQSLLEHEKRNEIERARLARLVLENTFPGVITETPADRHTKVGVPGFKDLWIPLGLLYIPFVIFVIVAISNAVNLTDGLDGLAAGASMISIFTFAAIAYVVSRADWSYYLYLTYVPEASELFVFAGALLGTGLGFLWFNAHPAEVFMGDTGSLALGGAIGTLAILTKQELLLPIVAGLFVLEAASVTIQVTSFKLTGKRVFRMAPLHHHFELLGWKETKVTMRFWIIAFLFALMSLATLKLR